MNPLYAAIRHNRPAVPPLPPIDINPSLQWNSKKIGLLPPFSLPTSQFHDEETALRQLKRNHESHDECVACPKIQTESEQATILPPQEVHTLTGDKDERGPVALEWKATSSIPGNKNMHTKYLIRCMHIFTYIFDRLPYASSRISHKWPCELREGGVRASQKWRGRMGKKMFRFLG